MSMNNDNDNDTQGSPPSVDVEDWLYRHKCTGPREKNLLRLALFAICTFEHCWGCIGPERVMKKLETEHRLLLESGGEWTSGDIAGHAIL